MQEKKIKGRKRHILVDTQGLLLTVNITAGNISDKQGFCQLLEKREQSFPSVRKVWADHGYQGEPLRKLALEYGIELEIVKRPPGRYRIYNENWEAEWIPIEREFSILPRRWVVERTLSWLGRNRRLSKEYDYLPQINWLYLAMEGIAKLTEQKDFSGLL
jgi:putative transposase